MSMKLSHVRDDGSLAMVDVGGKAVTARTARAEAFVRLSEDAANALRGATLAKGDALAAAQLAGIMAAKRTSELIPLCHPLGLSHIEVGLDARHHGVEIVASVQTTAQTGVEMEALTAVSVACLTLYDMLKAAEKGMVIEAVRLVSKTGGKSGDWAAD
jgi:cyclic pyranopterin phosphate synthase